MSEQINNNVRIWDQLGKTSQGENGCLLWMGARDKDGYGKVSIDGVSLRVHRVAFSEAHPEVDITGLLILHSCDNPPCRNPDHLFPGNHVQNHNDRGRKGRTARGSRHGRSKLTEDQVQEIRARYLPGNGQKLAEDYGVHRTAIHKIIHGLSRSSSCQR